MNKLVAFMAFCFVSMTILSFAAEGEVGLASTTLSSTVDQEETTSFTVTSTIGFLASDFFNIDNETVCYSSITPTTFVGLTRGCQNTNASSHVTGTTVYNEATGIINQAIGFNIIQVMSKDGLLSVMRHLPGALLRFFSRIILWNHSWLEGSLFGIPMSYFKYLLYCLSIGFVIEAVQLLAGMLRFLPRLLP